MQLLRVQCFMLHHATLLPGNGVEGRLLRRHAGGNKRRFEFGDAHSVHFRTVLVWTRAIHSLLVKEKLRTAPTKSTSDFKEKVAGMLKGKERAEDKPTVRPPEDRGYNPPNGAGAVLQKEGGAQ